MGQNMENNEDLQALKTDIRVLNKLKKEYQKNYDYFMYKKEDFELVEWLESEILRVEKFTNGKTCNNKNLLIYFCLLLSWKGEIIGELPF